MVSPKTQQILVILIVLLLLAFLGYKLFTKEPVALDTNVVVSSTEIVGQDILALVEQLKAISIDQDFFSSVLFNNLKDFSQSLFPEARGRVNPFATIGSDGSSFVATSTSGR